MYMCVAAPFHFPPSFIDAYSRYVVRHKLLIDINVGSVATELQAALKESKRC